MVKRKSPEEIKTGWNGLNRPATGQIFQHYKGGKYEIMATGFLEDSEEPCVIYRSLLENIVWVRTAGNFLENVEYNGKIQSRFKLIKSSTAS